MDARRRPDIKGSGAARRVQRRDVGVDCRTAKERSLLWGALAAFRDHSGTRQMALRSASPSGYHVTAGRGAKSAQASGGATSSRMPAHPTFISASTKPMKGVNSPEPCGYSTDANAWNRAGKPAAAKTPSSSM